MTRTPTFSRMNLDEIAEVCVPADVFVRALHMRGELLLIEDGRRLPLSAVPFEWRDAADKIRLGGITALDRTGTYEPTNRVMPLAL